MHLPRPTLQDYAGNKGLEGYIESLADHLHLFPEDIDAHIDFMLINARLGQNETYLQSSKKVSRLDPNNCYANRIRGRYCLCIERDPAKASYYLQLSLDQNPLGPAWVRYYSGLTLNYYERVATNLLYTPIGKNGSTTIKHIYAQRNGLDFQLTDPHTAFSNPFFEFTLFEKTELDASIKIAITRDPISRLTSYCQKNVLGESSLCQEVNAFDADSMYNLPLKPNPEELAANLWQYIFCFDDAMAHLLPQSVLMPNPYDYDIIGDISALEKVINQVDLRLGFKYETKVPKLMISHGTKVEPSESTKKIVTEFYETDYRMLERLAEDGRLVRM